MSVPAEGPTSPRQVVVAVAVLMAVAAGLAVAGLGWLFGPEPLSQGDKPRRTTDSPPALRTTEPVQSPSTWSPPATAVTVPGNPAPPATVPAARPSLDVKPPTPVSNLRLVESSATSVTVAWDPSSDNVAVTEYVVLLDGSGALASTVTVVRLDWLRRGAQLLIQVAAKDAAGNQSEWRSLVVVPAASPTITSEPPPPVTPPPATPTLTVTVTYTPTPSGSPSASPSSSPSATTPSASAKAAPSASAIPSSLP